MEQDLVWTLATAGGVLSSVIVAALASTTKVINAIKASTLSFEKQLQTHRAKTKEDIQSLRTESKEDIQSLKTEMKEGFRAFDERLRAIELSNAAMQSEVRFGSRILESRLHLSVTTEETSTAAMPV